MVQGTTLTTTPTTYLLAGFTNPLGKNITVQLVPGKGPTVGKLTLNANGSFTYTPPANYFGTVSFEFEILINGQVTDVFTATINVTRKLGKK
jgi:Bacterial Ig domain